MAWYTNYFGAVLGGLAWIVGIMVAWREGVRCRVSGAGGEAVSLQPSAFSRNEDESERNEAVSGGDATAPFSRRACPASNEPGAQGDGAPSSRSAVITWIAAGMLTLVLYLPWIRPFVHQLTAFPRVGGSASAYLAQAARVGLALTSGNLASLRVVWVHGPMALAGLGLLVLMIRDWRRVWPVAIWTIGCFSAGVASLSMLDKYVMTFSGPMCVLVAALLVKARATEAESATGAAGRGDRSVMGDSATRAPALALGARIRGSEVLRTVAGTMLLTAWISCYGNLFNERDWSSLRWLDPFETAVADAKEAVKRNHGIIVASHPAACYRLAFSAWEWRSQLRHIEKEGGAYIEFDPGALSRANREAFAGDLIPSDGRTVRAAPCPRAVSPAGAIETLIDLPTHDSQKVDCVAVIESSEFADDIKWQELRDLLAQRFQLTQERTYLEDPDAAWKDRLDPQFRHPRWRIVVRVWERKPTAAVPVGNP